MRFNVGYIKNILVSRKFKLVSVIAMAVMMFLSLTMMEVGAVTYGVKYTKHNLGKTAETKGTGTQWFSTNETEICVFCHAPHNANTAGGKKFLWNRYDSGLTFYPYTGSPTLNFSKATFAISEISKMCMSCHDGVTAVNVLFNTKTINIQGSGTFGENRYFGEFDFVGPANIGGGTDSAAGSGGDLTNDHPISFKYQSSIDGGDTTLNPRDGGGNSVGGLPLWNEKVECVTCHDPHINYYPAYGGDASLKPFLRKSNGSSGLCFTCHNK